MAKTYATIYVEQEVLHKAKEIGLNISKTFENALKEAIRRLEGTYSSHDPGIYRKPDSTTPKRATSKREMAGPAGIEPTTTGFLLAR